VEREEATVVCDYGTA